MYVGGYSALGYILWKAFGTSGTEALKNDKAFKDKEVKKQTELMVNTILGGGPSDLSALRGQTTKKGLKLQRPTRNTTVHRSQRRAKLSA